MIHSEYIVNTKTGEYILVETALRGGGVYISSHLVPLYTGFPNYNILFDCSIGKKINLSDVESAIKRQSSAYICFYLPIGKIIKVKGIADILHFTGVDKVDLNDLYVGKSINKMTNKTMRLGPIIVKGKNRSEVEAIIENIKVTLQITVEQPDGSLGEIIWD